MLGGAAVALPPVATLAMLRGGEAPASELVAGMWLFKALLIGHASLVVLGGAVRPWPGGRPLVELAGAVGRAPRWALATVAVLVAVGFALRIPSLGAGLWFDEIETLVSNVRRPLGELLTTFDSKNQHMLFSVLARGAVVGFGESAWSLRLPAMLLGVASIGALYWFGTLVTSRLQALAATAILALSYHHVWFSQNARGYTGLLLLSLAGSGLLLRMLATSKPNGWGLPVAYGATMALAMFTHATAIFLIAAHGLIWLALVWRRRPPWKDPGVVLPAVGFLLTVTITLQLYAVVLPQFVGTMLAPTMAGTQTEWKSPAWMLLEAVRGLQRGLPGGWLALVAGAGITTTGIVAYARRSPSATAVMLLPIVLTAVAIVVMGHNLWPRFFFFGAGFAILIAVRGVFAASAALLPRHAALPAALGMTAVLALGNAWMIPGAWAPKQDFEGALRYVEAERGPGDEVVALDLTRLPYRDYYATGWPVVESLDGLRAIERGHVRTWVLYTFPIRLSAVHPDIWAHLRAGYRERAVFGGTVGGGEVIVLSRE